MNNTIIYGVYKSFCISGLLLNEQEAKKLMLTNIAGEISERSGFSELPQ